MAAEIEGISTLAVRKALVTMIAVLVLILVLVKLAIIKIVMIVK